MQEITAKQVKELRDRTGVGILECRKALEATNGDMEAAIKYLRERGIAKAESKASRQTKEGLIHAYIHFNGRLGVMLELNCESDFVARTEQFKKLAQELALQIAATNPLAITSDQIDPVIIEREREIARNKAINEGKKPEIVEKIVEGTLKKFCSENALLEQELVNEPGVTVRDLINSTIAQTGENIQISRFVRYALGEE
ncbi:MAG TPA: translation elongation factor Ts [Candidatus Syntrophosphaera thermopropionivorans]|jgi:elongation factor Ts|uniref:Translation elongation factor Ts n=1 Tax=Candidatus Syntrophosphaera thermopropionivorans TaxID=2593015 RepID=A0AC61QHX2_9BACT|nr:translation elongation factor Ts [Candidatus Syntrophosphaera thermopropionivorans]MBP7932680.1 translation elongation factor Ts [Candidatus Syntrophosphaera sp.]NLA44885.1 translation elongation factor Ts [Candidatus Cloacimonadota bacterium]TDF72552.1 translation elongation factor Ts [Candidatus Syntrophosphaera thermopropionivorans]HOH82434.1 translation elongation factor Ts [Candidatus Syntrophosphaera thermopropionivorans]HON33096.1 translation elongation factor Ts [Candidatus Syntroph